MTAVYPSAFRAIAFPLLDRLNGTSIVPKLEFLLASERSDPEQMRARQAGKLADAINTARANSEFYRDFWRSASPGRGLASAYPPLDGLPVLTKEDLATARGEFPLPSFKGRLMTTRTSGSTGSPMTFYRSMEQESWFWALRFRMWSWAGYRPGDPYLEINLNPRKQWRKQLQDRLFRCTYLTFNADNQDSRRIVELLEKRRIPHINGFASSLFVLAKYMLDQGITNRSVAGITSTGDTLYPAYRDAIEAAFGQRVLDYYGAGGEGFHVASQCPGSGTRYHLHPENAVVEILGKDGPVPPGVAGRLVVTQLDNEAMPLVRYEIGDVAVAAPEGVRCACGRTLPLLEQIEGRIPDLIALPDGSFLVTHFFVILFKNLQDVQRYQVVQERPEAARIRLTPRPGCRKREIEAEVRRQVSAATRGLLALEFEWLDDDIPLSGQGKRRLVISSVARRVLAGSSIISRSA